MFDDDELKWAYAQIRELQTENELLKNKEVIKEKILTEPPESIKSKLLLYGKLKRKAKKYKDLMMILEKYDIYPE